MRRVKIYRDGEWVGSIPQPRCPPRDLVELGTFRHLEPKSADYTKEFFHQRIRFRAEWRHAGEWLMEAVLIAEPRTGDGDLEALDGFLYTDAYVEGRQSTRQMMMGAQ